MPILTVRKLLFGFVRFIGHNTNNATLCRIISQIFPNVEKLKLLFAGQVSMRSIHKLVANVAKILNGIQCIAYSINLT